MSIETLPAGALSDLLAFAKQTKPAFYRAIERNVQSRFKDFRTMGAAPAEWAKIVLGKDFEQKILAGYAHFVTDVNRQQFEYCKRGHYQNKSYAEAFNAVYDNDEYMKFYHWGVYATTFLWAHHLKIYTLFAESFAPRVPQNASVLDLGSGSGIWSTTLASIRPDIRSIGIDISKTSASVASDLARAAGVSDRAQFIIGDALKPIDGVFKAGISCFLLEHLENPGEMVANMARSLPAGAPAFFTAAITAAEIDHIYEFKSEGEVISLIEANGFRVELIICPPPDAGPPMEFLPRSIAVIATRKTKETW